MELARIVDEITRHRSATLAAASGGTEDSRLLLAIALSGDDLISGDQIDRGTATLLGRKRVSGATQEYTRACGTDLHRPTALPGVWQ